MDGLSHSSPATDEAAISSAPPGARGDGPHPVPFTPPVIDISALRYERQGRVGHHMLAHLRTEAYEVYRRPGYPPCGSDAAALSYLENGQRIEAAKRAFVSPPSPSLAMTSE